ncbi:hypothetical protein Hanom_Chr05g00416191 [Helianthus anomalus]
MIVDVEVNENVGEVETAIETESLATDRINENQMFSVNPLHIETFEQVSTGFDTLQEDPTADLHPRKQSRRDPRISREITGVSSSICEGNIPVVTAPHPLNATGTPVSDMFTEFLTNPKAAMYMPAAKASEGSSDTPSDDEVLKEASLLEQVVRESVATAEPAQEEVREPTSSPDSENLFGDVDVGIANFLEETTHKKKQIQELETNLGSLSAIVMDLKQKLEGKFGKEFAKPPKEDTAIEKEQMNKENEEAINKYIQDPPLTVSQRMKQKEVVMRNVGSEKNYGFQDLPDRYVIKTGKDIYDRYRNRTGIRSWAYNDEKGLFLVTRNNGKVEYYNSASVFESWIVVVMCSKIYIFYIIISTLLSGLMVVFFIKIHL